MTGKKYTLTQAAKILDFEYYERIYTVKDAAQHMGISDSHLRRLLEKGKVKGKKLGRTWMIRELKYRRKRKPKGRAER
jgi:excisionase family DNA binding protein